MPRDKKVFEFEFENNKSSRSQLRPKGKSADVDPYNQLVQPMQFTFPREVVLRLIDWVKHI